MNKKAEQNNKIEFHVKLHVQTEMKASETPLT